MLFQNSASFCSFPGTEAAERATIISLRSHSCASKIGYRSLVTVPTDRKAISHNKTVAFALDDRSFGTCL